MNKFPDNGIEAARELAQKLANEWMQSILVIRDGERFYAKSPLVPIPKGYVQVETMHPRAIDGGAMLAGKDNTR